MYSKQRKIDAALKGNILVTCLGDPVRESENAKYRLKVVTPKGHYPANSRDIEHMIIHSLSVAP